MSDQQQFTADQIDDYLANRMSEESQDAFETAMLSDPHLQQQVMLHAELKNGLTEASTELLETRESKPNLLTHLRNLIWQPQFAYGASLILGLGIYQSLPSDSSQTNPLIEDVVYLEQTRSQKPMTVNLKAQLQFLVSIDVSTNEPVSVMLRKDNTTVFNLASAIPNSIGSLNIVLPPLEPGQYTLSTKNPTNTQEFLINVLPQNGSEQ
jgi:hypothetical protein